MSMFFARQDATPGEGWDHQMTGIGAGPRRQGRQDGNWGVRLTYRMNKIARHFVPEHRRPSAAVPRSSGKNGSAKT
jgi:hypothetical protein